MKKNIFLDQNVSETTVNEFTFADFNLMLPQIFIVI